MVDQRTVNPLVAGSNPAAGATGSIRSQYELFVLPLILIDYQPLRTIPERNRSEEVRMSHLGVQTGLELFGPLFFLGAPESGQLPYRRQKRVVVLRLIVVSVSMPRRT